MSGHSAENKWPYNAARLALARAGMGDQVAEDWPVGSAMGKYARVRFGELELDLDTGELFRHGVAIKLQPQPSKVLTLLVGRAGQIVNREEIVREVWGGETFVDFEQ